MQKPVSLRAALVSAVPTLSSEPDRLLVFINKGAIVATGTRTPSFEYRYDCELIVTQYTGHPDDVMIAVVEWMRRNQGDVLASPDQREQAITFIADVLDNDAVDLAITVKLTESIVVGLDDDGRRTVQHVDDAADEARDA